MIKLSFRAKESRLGGRHDDRQFTGGIVAAIQGSRVNKVHLQGGSTRYGLTDPLLQDLLRAFW
nr:hypothetical protein [Halomonas sp. DP1Y21-3]